MVIISLENDPGAQHGWQRRSSADQRELNSFQFSLRDAAIYMYTECVSFKPGRLQLKTNIMDRPLPIFSFYQYGCQGS